MIRIFCNGPCGRELASNAPGGSAHKPTVCLQLERVDGLGGGGIPSGKAHLCCDCAMKAFRALK